MIIYDPTEYIETPVVGDVRLKVNPRWDFGARSVCFQNIPKTLGGGTELISYDLEKCVEIKDSFVIGSNPPKPCKNTKWEQANITDEIIEELIEKGYTLAKEFRAEEIPQFKGTLDQLNKISLNRL